MKKSLTQNVALSGMLTATAIILAKLSSTFLTFPLFGVPGIRIDLSFIVIIFAGIILGPFYGAAVGTATDLIVSNILPSGAYIVGMTLTKLLMGLLPGLIILIYRKVSNKSFPIWLFTIITTASVLMASFLNTLWLKQNYYQTTPYYLVLIPRLIAAAIMIPLFTAFIFWLYKLYKRISH